MRAEETVRRRLTPEMQRDLVEQVRQVKARAPFWQPLMPKTGHPIGTKVTAAGTLGWHSTVDRGYHYVDRHPRTGEPFPPMPQLWRDIASDAVDMAVWPPMWDSAIVNYYAPGSVLRMHQDKSEHDTSWPIVTICLGDAGRVAVRQNLEDEATTHFVMVSGTVYALQDETRDAWHGVTMVYDSPILRRLCGMRVPGRISITIRVAGK